MTYEERIKILAGKLIPVLWEQMNWQDITGGVGSASPEIKNKIVASLKEHDNARLGEILRKLVLTQIKDAAKGIVESDLADGNLSVMELDKYLE